MINYILLAITIVCTIFNIWLTLKDREGYDKGLEDGIRMTNEVLEEDLTEMQSIHDNSDAENVNHSLRNAQTDCPWR